MPRKSKKPVRKHSLPLMGIRNRMNTPAIGRAAPSSLPLMGIRNEVRRLEDELQKANSLPLMGISTSLPLMGISTSLPLMGISTSLPLMGISTSLPLMWSRYCGRDDCTSHYPSWGSETSAWRTPRSVTAAHYPSWGSENCVVRENPMILPFLTTPHGDQKRAGSPHR